MNKYVLAKNHIFDACIFDFDGTLVDTEKYHLMAWQKAFASFEIDFSREEYLPLRSTGRTTIIEYIEKTRGLQFTETQKKNLCVVKQQVFTSFVQTITEKDLISGAVTFLKTLRTEGILTAVATSSAQASEIAKRLSLNNYFSLFLDSTKIARKKPFPDIFLKAADALGVPARNCLVFEDSKVGIDASIAAEMQVISIGELQDNRTIMCIPNFCPLLQRN